MFCAAFLLLHFGFVVFGQKNIGAKSARKMLMKLTTVVSSWHFAGSMQPVMKTKYRIYAKMTSLLTYFRKMRPSGTCFGIYAACETMFFSQMLPLTTLEFETLVLNCLQAELLNLTYSCVLEEFTLVNCSVCLSK